jgi:hypothetical protein
MKKKDSIEAIARIRGRITHAQPRFATPKSQVSWLNLRQTKMILFAPDHRALKP